MLRGGSWQLGEKGTHYIKTIKNSSHHLANIINDILDAAAFSKGRLVIKREKASLYAVTLCSTASAADELEFLAWLPSNVPSVLKMVSLLCFL